MRLDNPFTGLFSQLGRVERRPHDPSFSVWAGVLSQGAGAPPLHVGGASLGDEGARLACVGEAIERMAPAPLRRDELCIATHDDLARDGAVDPEALVLFSDEQHRSPGFAFERLTRATRCRWVRCRRAGAGDAVWVPAELVFLGHDAADGAPHMPGVSTGLSAATSPDLALLRGLQEQIERDAVMGAFWGAYGLDELDPREVWTALGRGIEQRASRLNLTYRFLRVRSPFSDHVAVVTLVGEDREGLVISIGSACRETMAHALEKAVLEAVQGRHYVRVLVSLGPGGDGLPGDFSEHAAYFTRHPGRFAETRFGKPLPAAAMPSSPPESAATLMARLGPARPVLFRLMTPPFAARHLPGWVVLRVVVPGLTPLHGVHAHAHLASPLWGGRPLAAWLAHPPHPFP